MPNMIRNSGFEVSPTTGHPVPEWYDVENAEQQSFAGPDESSSALCITALLGDRGLPEGQIKQSYETPYDYVWSDLFFWVNPNSDGTSGIRFNLVYLGLSPGDPDDETNTPVYLDEDPRGEWIQKRVTTLKNRKIRRIKIEFYSTSPGDYCYLDNLYLRVEDDLWFPSLRRPPGLSYRELRGLLQNMLMGRVPFDRESRERGMARWQDEDYLDFTPVNLAAIEDPLIRRLDSIEERVDHVYRLILEQRYAATHGEKRIQHRSD